MKALLFLFVSAFASLSPRWMVHLLDYIALDYRGAVENGKVISQTEYGEMKEFTQRVFEGAKETPGLVDAEGLKVLKDLADLVEKKASPIEVARAAREAQGKILARSPIEMAPKAWPSLRVGMDLYQRNCVSCHGSSGKGDGAAGAKLDPLPSNFFAEKMESVSPFQAFNAIRLGVPGTAMAAFDGFSDQEVWALAFYVVSLRHGSPEESPSPGVKLEEIASKADDVLTARWEGSTSEKRSRLRAARTHVPATTSDFIGTARNLLKESLEQVRAGNFQGASQSAIAAYLEGVEPIELPLRSREEQLVQKLETAMLGVRTSIDKKATLSEIETKVEEAFLTLDEAALVLSQKGTSPAFAFSIAAGIFLREGFEAILILVTLLSVVRVIGAPQAIRAVHAGWMLAVFSSVMLWFFSGWLIGLGGIGREMMEGVVGILSVVVLFFVGFWLHRRVEITRWKEYVSRLAETAVGGGKLFALGSVAFMAVFREAFETVLFLRAFSMEPGMSQDALWAGVGASFVVILVLAALLVKFSVRIPVRQLFAASSVVVWFLAFILTGKAVHSFQEAGAIGMTAIPWTLRFEWLGWFPTYETVFAQILSLGVGGVLYVLSSSSSKPRTAS